MQGRLLHVTRSDLNLLTNTYSGGRFRHSTAAATRREPFFQGSLRISQLEVQMAPTMPKKRLDSGAKAKTGQAYDTKCMQEMDRCFLPNQAAYCIPKPAASVLHYACLQCNDLVDTTAMPLSLTPFFNSTAAALTA